jgi:RNA polymerase sigma-70 factor, ECF subfamily
MYLNPASSFNEVYTKFYRKSYLYVKSYVHDDMAAEDIVSEALIRLWERMKKETVDPISPFLFSILKNRSLDYLKHEVIKQGVHDQITQTLNRELVIRTSSLEASDPTDIFSSEVQQIVEDTLSLLPERTREIFIMSRFGNKPHKEIAELFNISVKGVDYHIMQSVKQLRTALKDYLPFLGVLAFLK